MTTHVFACLLLTWLAAFSAGCGDMKRYLYEGFGRDRWQQPERVVSALGIRPGESVADLGAGGGYFTFRLANATSAGGKVYAVDVDEEMVAHIEHTTQSDGRANIETVVAKRDDPMLPAQGVDLIFICNTYHHIENRVAYFEHIKTYLREKGRVAIIDFEGKSWFLRLVGHVAPAEDIRADMEAAGYRLVQAFDFLSKQNYQIFVAR